MLVNFKSGGAWVSKSAKKTLASMSPKDIKKILVIRHVAIGDMVMSRPFFVELRKYFPHAKITLSLIDRFEYGVPIDLVDRTHTLYKHKKNNGKTDYKNLKKQIKTLESYDLVFDQTDSALSTLMTRMIRAKIKIGFPHRQIKRFFYDATILRSEMVLETETLIHQLQLLGAPLPKTLCFATRTYKSNKKQPYIIYFPGASAEYKCWARTNFSALIDMMAKQYPNIIHVLLEGIRETETFDDIFEPVAHYPNVRKQKKLSLDDVMPFLGKSSLVISNDTGIRNMAISIDASTLGIFFSTVPFRYWPKSPKHHIAFRHDKKPPQVEEVSRLVQQAIDY